MEQTLAHKEIKIRGKVTRHKFKNHSHVDAKWMEKGDLADSPQVLELYLEAFQLEPKIKNAHTNSIIVSLPSVQEGDQSS